MQIMHCIDTNRISYKNIIFVDVDGINKMIRGVWCMVDNRFFAYLFSLRIYLNLYKLLAMFIKGNCAICNDKNLRAFKN